MLGLARREVRLVPHEEAWGENARRTIDRLRSIVGDAAIDMQHVGSSAVPDLLAKPIIDIAVGMRRPEDVLPFVPELERNGFLFRGEDVPGQLLLVRGDFEQDTRTHHIHVVTWDGKAWRDYVRFRDLLRSDPEKAARYKARKLQLAERFPHDRKRYTAGKNELIAQLLSE